MGKTMITGVFIVAAVIVTFAFFVSKGEFRTGNVVLDNNESSLESVNNYTNFPTKEIKNVPRTSLEVKIINFAYTPSEIEINAGDTVFWENRDAQKHTITSVEGNELDSGLFKKGETYSHTFNSPGTYKYYCVPHPYMRGVVVVK